MDSEILDRLSKLGLGWEGGVTDYGWIVFRSVVLRDLVLSVHLLTPGSRGDYGNVNIRIEREDGFCLEDLNPGDYESRGLMGRLTEALEKDWRPCVLSYHMRNT